MKRSVFISHASKDAEIARTICAMLEERGISCWIAPRDIAPGSEYADAIISGIENTIATVLILSEHANESIFVKKEIERAISKSKAVFPVRIREVLPSSGLELFISSTHWVDAWQSPIDGKMDQLANSIRSLEGKLVIPVINAVGSTNSSKKGKHSRVIVIGLVIGGFCFVLVIALAAFMMKRGGLSQTASAPEQLATSNPYAMPRHPQNIKDIDANSHFKGVYHQLDAMYQQSCDREMPLREKSQKCSREELQRRRALHSKMIALWGAKPLEQIDTMKKADLLLSQGRLDEAEKIIGKMETQLKK